MKIVFATNNKHKLEEIQTLLKNNFELLTLNDINCIDDIEETGLTFNENANIKASYIYKKYVLPVFADDSGLCVEALNYEPGVYSARYAGLAKDDTANNNKLIAALNNQVNRNAYFKTVICLIIDNKTMYFEGKIEGTISKEPKGNNGFGYDPLFIPNGYNITFAELGNHIKNKISHRALAFNKLITYLASIK